MWVAVIAAVPLTIAAIASLINSLLLNRHVGAITVRMNGRLDELLKLHHQAGQREGRMDERDERDQKTQRNLERWAKTQRPKRPKKS